MVCVYIIPVAFQIANLQEDLKSARSQLTVFELDRSKLTEESNTLRLLLLQKEVHTSPLIHIYHTALAASSLLFKALASVKCCEVATTNHGYLWCMRLIYMY